MKHKITWREADPDTGDLITRTELIEAETQKAALIFAECTYFWVTYPKVVRPENKQKQLAFI